jgi:GAF domain-containing protein
MKMLQSLSGKLNRLNDVRELGNEIAAELRSLIDYHNCRVFVVDGEDLVPIAFRGEFVVETVALPLELLRTKIGTGITGRCAETGESLLIHDAANCEFGSRIPGTPIIEESLLAVPLRYGARVVGVIVLSKLGLDQFDEDDVRLLEVLAGHAAVAVENASLYESARREAESATQLLEFGRELASASSLEDILERIVESTATLVDSPRTAVWIENEDGWLVPRKLHGHSDEERAVVEGRRIHVASARKGLGESPDPFVLGPEQYSQFDDAPPDPEAFYAIAPFGVGRRVG